MLTIDLETARRFILGKQGVWPGRRWQGLQGVEQAMRAAEYLQLDPLQIVARSQDIQLHSRVIDYTPGLWEQVTYGQPAAARAASKNGSRAKPRGDVPAGPPVEYRPEDRRFFDWGGWLAVRPLEELPYWRVVMRREREGNPRMIATAQEHAEAVAEMRAVLRERGTVSNRDFTMASRTRTQSYRGRKDSALALYYLWRTGEVMTHHRENFERVYALTEAVAPAHLIHESDEAAVDRFLVKKDIAFSGLSRMARAQDSYGRGVPFDSGGIAQIMAGLLAEGELIEVQVEGWKHVHCALASDAEVLQDLAAGRVPPAWAPLDTSTAQEVVFLAPLDPVSARGRAKLLFGFDYVWEVYKPEPQRKFGYYVLPILWGDKLVGRFDSKLDRASSTFVILGLWLEDSKLAEDEAFGEALSRGFARFARFLGAEKVDAAGIKEERVRMYVRGGPKVPGVPGG